MREIFLRLQKLSSRPYLEPLREFLLQTLIYMDLLGQRFQQQIILPNEGLQLPG